MAKWSALPLRLIVGYGFMAHGWAKLVRGPALFAATLHGLGIPAPDVMTWATIAIELGGGLAVIAGALLPLVALPLIATMLVAMVTVHVPFGFSSVKLLGVGPSGPVFGPPGYEVDLLYIACLVSLMLTGPGPFSWPARTRAQVSAPARTGSR